MDTIQGIYKEFDHLQLPLKVIEQVKFDDYYIKHGTGKKIQRKIFDGVQYDEFEEQKLTELQLLIEQEKIQLPPGWRRSDYLKYCYCGKFDAKKSLKALQDYLEWRNNPIYHALSDRITRIFEKGVIYQLGRDKDFRPIILINVYMVSEKAKKENNITSDEFIHALCYMLNGVKKQMFKPGFVENWVIFIDTNSCGLTEFPFKVIHSIIQSTSINFTCTLHRLYMINPCMSLYASWKIIENVMDADSAQKIKFFQKKHFPKLHETIDPNQLEKKYGGQLPNLTTFWPPIYTYPEYPNNIKEQISNKKKDSNDEKIMEINTSNKIYEINNQENIEDEANQQQQEFVRSQFIEQDYDQYNLPNQNYNDHIVERETDQFFTPKNQSEIKLDNQTFGFNSQNQNEIKQIEKISQNSNNSDVKTDNTPQQYEQTQKQYCDIVDQEGNNLQLVQKQQIKVKQIQFEDDQEIQTKTGGFCGFFCRSERKFSCKN